MRSANESWTSSHTDIADIDSHNHWVKWGKADEKADEKPKALNTSSIGGVMALPAALGRDATTVFTRSSQSVPAPDTI